MITPFVLSQKYNEHLKYINLLVEKVRPTVINFCEEHNFAFTSRIKTVESLAEKIETGRYNKWDDLDDFYACTVIIPTLGQEEMALDYFKSIYKPVKIIKRGQVKKSPDSFRYDSTRIICRLKKPEGLTTSGIYDISFEIQIRSAFEHAWSVATHDLTYKSDIIDWKRHRLSSQIKATVEQLDTLILSFEQAAPSIKENPWPELKSKKKIATLIIDMIERGKIPSEIKPKDWSRFSDNLYSLLKANKKEDYLDNALDKIRIYFDSLSLDMFPRSISLLQFITAILISSGFFVEVIDNSNYSYHITSELLTLFPHLKTINNVFDYQIVT
jgi:ppGpp synthetase/RelA/SpoT-type nucleotidyltranferase